MIFERLWTHVYEKSERTSLTPRLQSGIKGDRNDEYGLTLHVSLTVLKLTNSL